MPPEADKDQTQDSDADNADDQTGNPPEDVGEKKLELTQAELNDIILRRTEQARRKATEAADKAKKWDEHEASQRSNEEKAAAALAAAEKEATEKIAAADSRLIKAEVRQVASEKGIRKEALDLVVQLLATSEAITVNEDGGVDGAEAAVAALVKKHDYLTAKATPGKSGSDGFTGNDGKTDAQKIKDAEAARNPAESIRLKLKSLA